MSQPALSQRSLSRPPATYQNPYATRFPQATQAVPDEIPIRKPHERMICVRRPVKVTAKGKLMRYDAWCVVGDRTGSVALARGDSAQGYKAMQVALNRGRRTIRHYDLFQGRTLYHDITCEYGAIKLCLFAKPPGKLILTRTELVGTSVRAQRVIYDICQALGIQDMGAKIVRGSTNPITVARAFFHALDRYHKSPEAVARIRGLDSRQSPV